MKTMKKGKGIAVFIIVIAILGLLCWYTLNILSATTDSESDGGVKLGLDLSGGVSVTYQIVNEDPSQEDINDTIAKLEERAAAYNDEYAVYQEGTDRITVEIPGVSDANAVLEDLGSPGSLYFIKQTDDDGSNNYTYDGSSGSYLLLKDIETLIDDGSVILTGTDIADASAGYQTNSTYGTNEPVVQITMTDAGAEIFAEATKEAYAAGESIGIYYDDHFISVPSVNAVISDGNCIIEGMDSYEDADSLATFIRIGAINLELEEMQSQVVGAQLGSQALSTSFLAAGIGLALVIAFMIVLYGISGVAASLALIGYTTLVVDLIYWFDIVLTLPGIAGIILGVGMAVDANVIIFARIREEITRGKSVNAAMGEGYNKALSAIIDGNVTTFIAAVVLRVLGSGTVKGFANTLMISVLVSMFTALFVAKLLMRCFYAMGIRDQKFYGTAKDRGMFHFIEHKAIFFGISIAIIAAGFIGMGVYSARGSNALNYSLDFVGGTSTTADFGREYTIEELESGVIPVIEDLTGDNDVHATVVDGSTSVVIKTKTLDLDEREELSTILQEQFDVDADTITSESISSTVSGEMRQSAIIAVVVACICMLLYIWFRFKDIRFASSAIIALVHDVLVVLTTYALLRISVGNTFIACMLTIVGYSINDTIVIFDRIRENLHNVKNPSDDELREIANHSLTQTLSRSINTSITTIIMVLMLYILGVDSIREFSLPLLTGLIAGTYSSIFIATALWYIMKTKFKKKKVK